LTCSTAVFVTPAYDDPIVTFVFLFSVFVVTVNDADVVPAETVTLAGNVATFVFELDKLTVVPPAGAPIVSCTVPVAVDPPTTLVGLSVSDDNATAGGGGGGFTVNVAAYEIPS
jgi:hypothetical protein